MSYNLLPIPYRTTVNFDLGEVLKQVITDEYYQTANSFQDDIHYLKNLRNKVFLCLNDQLTTPENIDVLKTYYIHLSSLLLKFPSDLAEFPWYGTLGYNVTGPVRIKTISFEQLNVIYDLGAAFSQLAIGQPKSTDDGYKKAYLYFQQAAGCFEFIIRLIIRNESLKNKFSLPLDLQLETINTLKSLMIAQAQEIFWQKAVSNKVKPSVLAKLSIQVSHYYDICITFAQRSEAIRSDWVNHMKVKKFHFEAAAQFRQSMVCAAEGNYGEEVARLKLALKLTKKALSFLRYTSQEVQQNTNSFNKLVSETLKSSEKDNDLIYLKVVPEEDTLKEILPAPMVKPIILKDLENPLQALTNVGAAKENDISIQSVHHRKFLFTDLLPYFVIQIAQAFRERQESYVKQQIIDPINALNTIIDRYLAERNLPASIESMSQNEELPKSLIVQIEEIKNLGGIHKVQETLEDINRLALHNKQAIEGVRERLQREFKEDSLLRERYGTNFWQRESSEVAAKSIINEINEAEGYLQQAQSGDEIIREAYELLKTNVQVLCEATPEQLQKMVPTTSDDGNNASDSAESSELNGKINHLKKLLSDVQIMKNNRKKLVEVTEIKSAQMNILPKVIQEYKYLQNNNKLSLLKVTFENSEMEDAQEEEQQNQEYFEQVYETHIKGFNNELKLLNEESKKQKALESEIDIAFKEYQALKNAKANAQVEVKEKFFVQLQNIHTEFIQLIQNLNQGLQFYNNFNVKTSNLLQITDSYVDGRRLEARDLERQISTNISIANNSAPSPVPVAVSRPYNSSTSSFKRNDQNQNRDNSNQSLVSPQPKKTAGLLATRLWDPSQGIRFE